MIRSFRDKKTERLFAGEVVREFSGIRNVAERKLVMLDSATDLKDLLAPPGNRLEKLIRQHNAKVLEIEEEYIIVEKTGHADETEALLEALKEIGIFEFVRSGRVAIPRPMERLSKYLRQLELEAEETL